MTTMSTEVVGIMVFMHCDCTSARDLFNINAKLGFIHHKIGVIGTQIIVHFKWLK